MTAPPNPDVAAFPYLATFYLLTPYLDAKGDLTLVPERDSLLPILERIVEEINHLFENRRIRQKARKQKDTYLTLRTTAKPPYSVLTLTDWYKRETHRCGLLLVIKEICEQGILDLTKE